MNLPDTYNVLDATKLNAYMTCPRKFFFEYVLGWRPPYANHDLHFGQAVHLALEHIYEEGKKAGRISYDPAILGDAFDVFLEHYREAFPPHTDSQHPKKNPENFAYLLQAYGDRYQREDTFKILHTEVSGSIPIGCNPDGSDKLVYFKQDTLCEDKYGRQFILEHKTSQWSPILWADTWGLAIQPAIGCIFLYMYFGETSKGIILNGVFFTKDPTKCDFLRLPISKQSHMLEAFRGTLESWHDKIHQEYQDLTNDKPDNLTMAAFPQNAGSCLKYNRRCIYQDLCLQCPNPLRISEEPPTDFAIDHWDPRKNDKAYTATFKEGELK